VVAHTNRPELIGKHGYDTVRHACCAWGTGIEYTETGKLVLPIEEDGPLRAVPRSVPIGK
jgi:hypothetical protein